MLRFFAFFLLISQFSFAQNAVELKYFEELDVRGNVHVELIPADQGAIHIASGEKHRVLYTIKDEKLKIKHQNLLGPKGWDDCAVRIKVYYEDLRAIKAIAGASVEAYDAIEGLRCDLHFASGGEGEIALKVAKSNMVLKQGAELELNGLVQQLDGKVITGGEFDAFDLDCETAALKVSTGGEACITASKSLEAIARTGGCLIYSGDPDEIAASYSLWGTIMSKRK